ncbi:MAG: HlyD family efflux transporter periplasmic adaptor subunit [Acidobacteria bacterium]|nr:HlyD family efflux transporter periplasmic adaptor subunit [Acidobacteriota bacterium]
MYIKFALVLLILSATAGCDTVAGLVGSRKAEAHIPVVRVAREPVEAKIHLIGELGPSRSAMIVAPPAGGILQIVSLAKTGTMVKEGDIAVQFDPSEQEYNLEQSKSQLEEAEQQIRKMKADQAVRVAQEQVTLLKAEYDVKRAELKVKGNDLLSGIEARKNIIALEEARRKLEQLRRDIRSRASSDAADLIVQDVARTKAMMGMKMAQQFIDNMTCRAPISGVVVVARSLESLVSAGGVISINSEDDIPELRPGSQIYPGNLVAQIQDVEHMEISSKVIETDRANIESGRDIDVIADSKPLKIYKGKIKSLAQSASNPQNEGAYVDYLEGLSTRSFAALFQVDTQGDAIRMGVTARVTVSGNDVRDALSLPRQALHQKEGKTVVYVRRAEGWEPRDVRVQYLTESRAVIEGLPEGTEVALVNPEQEKTRSAGKTGPVSPVLGGATQ